MEQDANTSFPDLVASQGALLAAIYEQFARVLAELDQQRAGPDQAEQAKAYRALRNPMLGQTTPANGIDIADRTVIMLANHDRATIVAGAEALMRLLLAVIEANGRRAYEKNRQSEQAKKSASKLPVEHQYFLGELEKRGVTRSMFDTFTSEEFDVVAQLIQQKNDNPTHPTLKGLWNFTYRCGVVNYKVIGLTDDEKDAIRLVSQVDASAGMAAKALFDDAAGRNLDLPLALALALLADLRAEKRSRGLRRTADQLAADDYHLTNDIIRKALGLRDDQVAELVSARSHIFDRHFDEIERRQAEAAAEQLEELKTYIAAAQTMRMHDEQAAADSDVSVPVGDVDLGSSKFGDADDLHLNYPARDAAGTASDAAAASENGDLPSDMTQQRAALELDRLAFAGSSERIENLEDLELATLLRDYPHIRDAARRSGVAMPGDDRPAGSPVATTDIRDREVRSNNSQPRSSRENRSNFLKGCP